MSQRASDTILCVHEDPQVSKLTSEILRRQGYTVFQTRTLAEASRLSREHPVDLWLTDVVPSASGPGPARESFVAAQPGVKVLFLLDCTSGLADRALQKPFTPAALIATVRRLLESPC